jgi:hypothetical protein
MNNTKIIFAILLAITAAFCFAMVGATAAMIGLNHVSAKLGFAIAVFSLLTGWLSVESIVDIIFERV